MYSILLVCICLENITLLHQVIQQLQQKLVSDRQVVSDESDAWRSPAKRDTSDLSADFIDVQKKTIDDCSISHVAPDVAAPSLSELHGNKVEDQDQNI